MNHRRNIIKGSLVLTVGEALGYGASFLRNMLLARLLTKADFGLAASFALVISLMELVGKMAIGQLVVQDRDGDKPQFIATAQFIQFVAGFVSAVAIIGMSTPMALILGVEDRAWAFRWLALLPLFKGLENLDVRRMGRDLKFIPAMIVEVVPQLLITLAVWPLSLWFGDYRLVLVLLVAKSIFSLIASHVLSEIAYRWSLQPSYGKRIFTFGWPLVLNSMLMFGALQCDQLLVGANYSMVDLAAYSAAASLTFVPGSMIMNVISSILLPVLAKVQDDPERLRKYYRISVQIIASFSVFYAMLLIVAAEAFMTLVFGQKYSGGGILLAWLSTANSLRLLRYAPALTALSRADSKNQLLSNILRATALIPAFIVASSRQPLWMVATVGIVGEVLALSGTLHRLNKRHSIPYNYTLYPALFCISALAIAGLFALLGAHFWNPVVSIGIGLAMGVLGSFSLLRAFPEAWGETLLLFTGMKDRFQAWSIRSRPA